jgi:hypothetical protein
MACRSYRGLAGAITYRARRKGWSIDSHPAFPRQLQDAVVTMLLCHQRRRRHCSNSNTGSSKRRVTSPSSSVSPSSSAYPDRHSANRDNGDSDTSPKFTNKIRRLSESMFGRSRSNSANSMNSTGSTKREHSTHMDDDGDEVAVRAGSMSGDANGDKSVPPLSRLPQHTVYYIMEFMVRAPRSMLCWKPLSFVVVPL